MVASGVPEKIDTHAQEICRMALDLLAKVSQNYKISKICTYIKINDLFIG